MGNHYMTNSFLSTNNIANPALQHHMSSIRLHLGNAGQIQQRESQRASAAEISFSYLFSAGLTMLLLLKAFTDTVALIKKMLSRQTLLVQSLTDSNTAKGVGANAGDVLLNIISGARDSNTPEPNASDAGLEDVSAESLGQQLAVALNDNKYRTAKNVKKISIYNAQDIALFTKTQKNNIGILKGTAEAALKKQGGDVNSSYKTFTDALNSISRVWQQMSRF